MGIKSIAGSYASALRIDKHHTIERFGVIFSVITVTFVLLLMSTITSAMVNNRAALADKVIYTPSFTTSKTQLGGTLHEVYTSTDGRTAMVLMQFDDALAGGFSADAAKYQSFLTASDANLNTDSLATDVSGEIVVFGTTGYLGVLLESDEPFEQQILNLTVRANAELTYTAQSPALREDLRSDESFAEFDQWRVFFNPGALGTQQADSLDGGFDATAFYAEAVLAEEEGQVRAEMDEQLMLMRTDLVRISEFSADLDRVDVDGVYIVPPAVPVQIAGDVVTGEPATGGEPSTLSLEPVWTSPYGFDFDWRSGSVAGGYLDALVGPGESYVSFLAGKSVANQQNNSSQGSNAFQVNDLEWRLTDGSDLRMDYTSADITMKPLTDVMNNLSQAYQVYYQHKEDYQIKSYGDLINLEVELRNVDSSYSVNDSDEAVLTY